MNEAGGSLNICEPIKTVQGLDYTIIAGWTDTDNLGFIFHTITTAPAISRPEDGSSIRRTCISLDLCSEHYLRIRNLFL